MTSAKKNVLFGAVVVLLLVGLWGISVWHDLQTKPANDRIQAGVQKVLVKEPRVRPLYDEAMKDGVLTLLEAKAIVDRANELMGK